MGRGYGEGMGRGWGSNREEIGRGEGVERQAKNPTCLPSLGMDYQVIEEGRAEEGRGIADE